MANGFSFTCTCRLKSCSGLIIDNKSIGKREREGERGDLLCIPGHHWKVCDRIPCSSLDQDCGGKRDRNSKREKEEEEEEEEDEKKRIGSQATIQVQ